MANPMKATTHTQIPPESESVNKTWDNPATTQMLQDQERAQTRSIIIYAILVIAVLVGGYYLYTTEWPSTPVMSAVTKTDIAPTPNAPVGSATAVPAPPAAGSTTAVPSAPPAASTTVVPAAPAAATAPAAGNPPAPATTPKP